MTFVLRAALIKGGSEKFVGNTSSCPADSALTTERNLSCVKLLPAVLVVLQQLGNTADIESQMKALVSGTGNHFIVFYCQVVLSCAIKIVTLPTNP